MKQLSTTDAQMLYIETPSQPNHIAPLCIYDPSTAPDGKVTHKGILANLEARLQRAPNFRRKLVRVPLDLDEPYWVDDRDFDLEYHVRHLALPKPGDWRQLCILAARLISRPLDPTRPLWEMNIIEGLDRIEGLPPGCFAVLLKIHHSLVDGKAGIELINILHDLDARASGGRAAQPWQPEPAPSPWTLARIAVQRAVFIPGHALRIVGRNLPQLIRFRDTKREKVPLRVPLTQFNRTITAARVYDAKFYPLEEVRQIRALAAGATVNDVALSIVAGCMRRYLQAKNGLPDDSLVVSVPISIRSPDAGASSEGNQLIVQNIPLHTDIADPARRLAAICGSMGEAKAYVEAIGARQLAELSTALPGIVGGFLARTATTLAQRSGTALLANTVVTNVPGVQVPLYMTGAKLVTMCGGGPLPGTMGIVHLISSYCGRVSFNYIAARNLLPDPQFYSQCLQASYDEHLAAARSAPKGEGKTGRAGRKQTATKQRRPATA